MTRRGKGWIVNIVSGQAGGAGTFMSAYAASKAGLVRLTEAIATECATTGVSVFALTPGVVHTRLNMDAVESEAALKWRGESKYKFVGVEPAVNMVLFLASGAVDRLSGRSFHVDDDTTELTKRPRRSSISISTRCASASTREPGTQRGEGVRCLMS